METRLLVEQFAIAKVISLNIELSSAPYEAIARQEQFAAAQEPRRFIEADHEFHRAFVAALATPSCSSCTTRCATASIAWDSKRCTATTHAPPRRWRSTAC